MSSEREQILADLRARLRTWQPPAPAAEQVQALADTALAALLPGGVPPGSLVEWLAAEPGSGAGCLALQAAWKLCGAHGLLALVDRQAAFYPPAAAALGVELSRLLVVRPQTPADEVWALEQLLRSPAPGALWCAADSLGVRELRRLQLAAEAGRRWGLFVRPAQVRAEPCFAFARLWVQPVAAPQAAAHVRRWRVAVLHARQQTAGAAVELELAHAPCAVRVVSPLAAAAPVRRSTGA